MKYEVKFEVYLLPTIGQSLPQTRIAPSAPSAYPVRDYKSMKYEVIK